MLLFVVNDLVEEEIKSGIAPERIVSKYHLRNFLIFYFFFQIVGGFSM